MSQIYPDGTQEYWLNDMKLSLNEWAGAMAQHRNILRQHPTETDNARIISSRWAMASFLKGLGAEVGAGNRPVPVHPGAKVVYGDIREGGQLEHYFGSDIPESVRSGGMMDAQTWAGYEDVVFDFVISAHVLEHLMDPIGSLRETMRVLKPGGHYLLIVPDMDHTFDRKRPPTDLDHLKSDAEDGGLSTRTQSYEEHLRFIVPLEHAEVPEESIPVLAKANSDAKMDIHFHAWTRATFDEFLAYCETILPFKVLGGVSVVNENQFLLQKTV